MFQAKTRADAPHPTTARPVRQPKPTTARAAGCGGVVKRKIEKTEEQKMKACAWLPLVSKSSVFSLFRFSALLFLLLLPACAANKPRGDLAGANRAYQAGQYTEAYALSQPLAGRSDKQGDEAAYLAGLSAKRLNRTSAAERYLTRAAQARDDSLAGDAGAALGLIYSEQGRYAAAARALGSAAPKLSGEDRAKAYYYLALAEQKLGRTAGARTSFRLAHSATSDPILRRLIQQQRATLGWTVQTGAYRDIKNARAAAQQLTQRVRGASPRLVQATDPHGRAIVLLQIGTFTTHHSARRFANQLGQNALVVPLSR